MSDNRTVTESGNECNVTEFASPERATKEECIVQSDTIKAEPAMTTSLEAMPHMVIILNSHRQIVFANRVVFQGLGVESLEDVLGLRPGEALDCVHACESPCGCGTNQCCKTCGAVLAILASLDGTADSQECRIIRRTDNEAMDLQVTAVPVTVGDKLFTIVSALDISHKKRRRVLERIFFHDVLNSIGAVQGLINLFTDESMSFPGTDREQILSGLQSGVYALMEEIVTQKDLAAAESDELEVKYSYINSADFLINIVSVYSVHSCAEGRTILIDQASDQATFSTDKTLLRRVVGNMLKNALEASCIGETVTIRCNISGNNIRIAVHNRGVIAEDVRLQIFQRSFSTKGQGRGIGTYSMKLLGEHYLNSRVGFSSAEPEGTVFYIDLPLCSTY